MRGRVLLVWALMFGLVCAQEVRIVFRDGRTPVQGRLLGYENGKYVIEVQGVRQEYDERDVFNVEILSSGRPPRPPEVPPSTQDYERARSEKEFRRAIELLKQIIHGSGPEYQKLIDELAHLHLEYLRTLMETEDVTQLDAEIAEVFAMPPGARGDLVDRVLVDYLEQKLRERPRREFTYRLARELLRQAAVHSLNQETRGRLVRLLEEYAEYHYALREYAKTVELLEGLAKVEAEQREKFRKRATEIRLVLAQHAFNEDDFDASVATLEQVLAEHADHTAARELYEEALKRQLQVRMAQVMDVERLALLEVYLKRARKLDYVAWARDERERLQKRLSGETVRTYEDLRRYFPAETGRWWTYRRDSEILERLKVTRVTPEKSGNRIELTQERIFKSYSDSLRTELEMTGDTLYRVSGGEREIFLRFPVRKGEGWEWKSGAHTYRRRVIDTDKTVRVEAGTFRNCLEVEFSSAITLDSVTREIVSREYYAPGVGLVKIEFADARYRRYGVELLEYGRE